MFSSAGEGYRETTLSAPDYQKVNLHCGPSAEKIQVSLLSLQVPIITQMYLVSVNTVGLKVGSQVVIDWLLLQPVRSRIQASVEVLLVRL